MSTKLRLAVAVLIASGTAVVDRSWATPWQAPGDPKARHALQRLADRGLVDRSVTTWPVMWQSVSAGLGVDSQGALESERAYLWRRQADQLQPGLKGTLSVAGSSEAAVFRGFEDAPREHAEVGVSLAWQGDRWAANLAPAYAIDPEDDETLRLDGSYLAGMAGNWVLGVGAVDRWWGPGWGTSLILSTNARPMPALWLNRNDAMAPETSWLSWIGPWQLTLLAGQYESERTIPDAKLIGMRATVRPLAGLDIGLSRAIMWGGEGRPESGSSLWDALIGRDNQDAGDDEQDDDPSNQLASIDIRYGFGLGQQSMGVYVQVMGEDEAGAFPAKKSWLLGMDWTTSLGNGTQQWFAEYINTLADDVLGTATPNVSYEHGTYQSGYRYYGRNLAATIEGDARGVVVGGYHFLSDGSTLGLTVTSVDLNVDGTHRVEVVSDEIFYNVPEHRQKVTQATASYSASVFRGRLTLRAQFADRDLEFVSGTRDQWNLAASWRYRFGDERAGE